MFGAVELMGFRVVAPARELQKTTTWEQRSPNLASQWGEASWSRLRIHRQNMGEAFWEHGVLVVSSSGWEFCGPRKAAW